MMAKTVKERIAPYITKTTISVIGGIVLLFVGYYFVGLNSGLATAQSTASAAKIQTEINVQSIESQKAIQKIDNERRDINIDKITKAAQKIADAVAGLVKITIKHDMENQFAKERHEDVTDRLNKLEK